MDSLSLKIQNSVQALLVTFIKSVHHTSGQPGTKQLINPATVMDWIVSGF